MIPTKLTDWTYEALSSLCAAGQGESERHDFKHVLPDATSLTKLCCAFANSAGGFVVLGVRDAKGEPFEPLGIEADKELFGKFVSKVRAAPDIPIEQPLRIDIPNSYKLIYVFEVRQSLRSPHLPIHSDERIFWKRQGSSCVQMTLEEIRYQMNSYEDKREKLALLAIDLRHKVDALDREARLSSGGYAPEFIQSYSFDIIDRVVVEAYSFLKGDPVIFEKLDEFRAHLSGLNAAKQRVILTAASPVPLVDRNLFLDQQVRVYHGQLTSVKHRAASLAKEIRQSIKEIADISDPYDKL